MILLISLLDAVTHFTDLLIGLSARLLVGALPLTTSYESQLLRTGVLP